MKMLNEHELEAIVAGGVDMAVFDEASLRMVVERIVRRAAERGLVLTVEQQPLKPLAMRNYRTVVSIRYAR